MRRTLSAAALGFAAGLAVGWLIWSHARDAAAPADRRHAPAVAPTSPDAAARESPKRPRRSTSAADPQSVESSSGGPGLSAPVAADVRQVPLADAPTGWTDLVVEFRDADGNAVGPGWGFHVVPSVHAAGAAEPWDIDGVAGGQTDAGGRALFRVASPGRYDVWTTTGMAFVVARGVDVPATGVVRVVKPSFADLTVSLDDAAATGDAAITVGIEGVAGEEVTSGGAVLTTAPGAWNVPLNAGARTAVCPLVSAMRWRILAPDGFVATPSEARPPARVVVGRAAAGTRKLRIEWRIGAAAHAPPFGRTLRFDWRIDGGPLVHESVTVDPDAWTHGAVALVSEIPVGAGNGALRWSGPDVEAGSLPFDLSSSDGATPLLKVPPEASALVRIEVETADGPAPAKIPVAVADPQDRGAWERGELVPGIDATLGSARWVVALSTADADGARDDRVAGPVLLRGGGRHDLRYVRGGYAIVAPRGRLPSNAGAVEVARADGGPIVFVDSDGARQAEEFAPVIAGTVLGPFEPGVVTLDLFLGRVRWARYEVTVRAGEDTVLPIGPFGSKR